MFLVPFFVHSLRKKKGEDQPTRGCINAVAETTNPCEKFDGLKSFSHPILLSCSVQRNSIVENRTRWKKREEKEGRKGRISTCVFGTFTAKLITPSCICLSVCAHDGRIAIIGWSSTDYRGIEREQGINRLERGKEKVMGARGGVNPEVELNRRRWKSIGRSTSNNSHATSIVATCSVVRSYKISLRGIGRVRGRERKAEERG